MLTGVSFSWFAGGYAQRVLRVSIPTDAFFVARLPMTYEYIETVNSFVVVDVTLTSYSCGGPEVFFVSFYKSSVPLLQLASDTPGI